MRHMTKALKLNVAYLMYLTAFKHNIFHAKPRENMKKAALSYFGKKIRIS